jgi:hypothetical protein
LLTIATIERHVKSADAEHEPLDGFGFLDLASASGAVPITDFAGRSSSFVLLAAGGVGKSEVLDDLRRREDGFEVELVGLRGADVGRSIAAGVASGRPVYLDSLDEALSTEPALIRLVNRAMSSSAAGGVAWRLACRPSAWSDGFVDGIGSVKKLRLLPMTREAARRLLASLDIDEGFLEAISAAGQVRLNASVLHFLAAARRWQAERRLPHVRADALDWEIRRLLAERENVRQPLRTGADVRHRAAGRLAFFTAFGGIGRFAFRDGVDHSAMAIADLPTVPEPDRPDSAIRREVYEEVLGSSLFDAAPHSAVAFRHQEYVDYLAARYVVERSPTRSQIGDLLGLTNGVLPRPMVAVAAWLVALRPDLVDVVAARNAVALVESEVDLPPSARAAVVEVLLNDAREHESPLPWSLDLSVVAHPELGRQLTVRVAAYVSQPFEAWWICRLALAGQIAAVVPSALTIALDGRLPSWARRPAIATVTELGNDAQRSALLHDLLLSPEADPDDELRAGLLAGLYPQHMDTAQLLPFITRPRQALFFGAYRLFLRGVAARVPGSDLPAVLAWARATLRTQISIESRRWIVDVSATIVARAIELFDDPAVQALLADLVIDLTGEARIRECWAMDPLQRQRVAVAVAARLDARRWTVLLQHRLVTTDDIDWLIDAVNERRAGHEALARCLERLTAPPAPPDEEDDANEQERGARPDSTALRAAIVAAQQDLASWANIPIALVNSKQALFSCDLTARPGWSLLTTEEQHEVLELGLSYVAAHAPDPDLWRDKTSINLDVVRAWSGVYLLTTLTRHGPDRLDQLSPTTWMQWAPAIAGAWAHGGEALLGGLVDRAPAEARNAIRAEVRTTLTSRSDWRRTPLVDYFARDFAADLAALLSQGRYPDDQNADILAFLIENDQEMAFSAARSAATGDGSQLSRAANLHLGRVDPHSTVDRLLNEAPVSAQQELLDALPLDAVDDSHLVALARLLLGPQSAASESENELRDVEDWIDSPVERRARIRNRTVEVMAMRGLATELSMLANASAPHNQQLIRHYMRTAEQAAADNAHVRLDPASLLNLLGRAELRLIRNSGDLIKVLKDHLDELQHEISRNNGFRELWSPDGKTLRGEDDITDWLQRRLTERLGRGLINLARETQVERLKVKGFGTRIDLTASAPTATAPIGLANAIIEAKLVTNGEVPTALRNQLVQRYLEPNCQRHGIYLVYWIPPDQRTTGLRQAFPDKQQLLNEMQRWAAEVEPQYEICAYALDVSWPNRPSSPSTAST